jgi:hypothetical protein
MRQGLSSVLDMVAEKVLAPTRFQAILLVEAAFHIRTKRLFYTWVSELFWIWEYRQKPCSY